MTLPIEASAGIMIAVLRERIGRELHERNVARADLEMSLQLLTAVERLLRRDR